MSDAVMAKAIHGTPQALAGSVLRLWAIVTNGASSITFETGIGVQKPYKWRSLTAQWLELGYCPMPPLFDMRLGVGA
eukprot:13008496-Alexandrium_andersonii.AAC.1